jgi:hypothetical protein
MPECRCRTEAANYRKKSEAALTFLWLSGIYIQYDLSISYSKNNTISSCLWTCRVYQFPLPAVWKCTEYPFHHYQQQLFQMPESRTVRHLVSPVPEWTKIPMPEPVQYRNKGPQSGTRLRYRIPECRCRRHRTRCRCPAMGRYTLALNSK